MYVKSLKKSKIFSLTIPAKIQSYLACGKPIIASLDGEGAKIVEKANNIASAILRMNRRSITHV